MKYLRHQRFIPEDNRQRIDRDFRVFLGNGELQGVDGLVDRTGYVLNRVSSPDDLGDFKIAALSQEMFARVRYSTD